MRSAYIKRPPNNLVFYIDRRQAAAPEHGTTSSSMIFCQDSSRFGKINRAVRRDPSL